MKTLSTIIDDFNILMANMIYVDKKCFYTAVYRFAAQITPSTPPLPTWR